MQVGDKRVGAEVNNDKQEAQRQKSSRLKVRSRRESPLAAGLLSSHVTTRDRPRPPCMETAIRRQAAAAGAACRCRCLSPFQPTRGDAFPHLSPRISSTSPLSENTSRGTSLPLAPPLHQQARLGSGRVGSGRVRFGWLQLEGSAPDPTGGPTNQHVPHLTDMSAARPTCAPGHTGSSGAARWPPGPQGGPGAPGGTGRPQAAPAGHRARRAAEGARRWPQ